ncbi:MAG TPA: hypothetical protein VHY20_05495, partial [Pirellulales bacterium]|nr:hypothetical protein [Pirellulales bacterium]
MPANDWKIWNFLVQSAIRGRILIMELDLPQTTADDQGSFLRRFLPIQTSLYRYVCAVAPVPQDARDIVQETAL